MKSQRNQSGSSLRRIIWSGDTAEGKWWPKKLIFVQRGKEIFYLVKSFTKRTDIVFEMKEWTGGKLSPSSSKWKTDLIFWWKRLPRYSDCCFQLSFTPIGWYFQIPQASKTVGYEFEKKVQIEMEHLVYFDRLKRPEAEKQAKQTVSEKFEVA